MVVYKITNKTTNKVYIGQTIQSLETRWNRHCTDAMNKVIDTHFARAIRKYGKDDFVVEIIDTAISQQELTEKESYWIKYYNSVNLGYNSTDAQYKCGGNTYMAKTKQEMDVIKTKISDSKKGGKNPNSTKIKCYNINTQEEKHFNSMAEAKDFFNEKSHVPFSARCRGKIRCLYKKEWKIGYENEEYLEFTKEKGNRNSKRITVEYEGIINDFPSYAEAERYYNLSHGFLSGRAYEYKDVGTFTKQGYTVRF